jgi:hypothetical protein
VVVVGRVGSSEGISMFGVRERIRTGQPIRLITPEQFLRLTERDLPAFPEGHPPSAS